MKRTELKRGGPLKRTGSLKRSGKLRHRSKGSIAKLESECDQLWKAAIHLRDKNRCRESGAFDLKLDAAHIFTRSRHATRWSVHNGVSLLPDTHMYFHANPNEFMEWVRKWWPHTDINLDELEAMSNRIQPVTEMFLLGVKKDLTDYITSLAVESSMKATEPACP